MAYQRKKRSQENIQPPLPTEQSSLFTSPDLDVADAENTLSEETRIDDTATLELRRKQANQSGFDFGSVPIFPADQANPSPLPIQRQPQRPLQLQPKLTVGPVGDRYEQEADRVADQVVNTINSPVANTPDANSPVQRNMGGQANGPSPLPQSPIDNIQRMEPNDGEELQMEPTPQRVGQEGGAVPPHLSRDIQSAKGNGQSLDPNLQQHMGQAMGADFSGVKIHTDAQSDQLNQSIQAKAFTTGQDVFFRQGAYNPDSKDGQRLIAHELTHVVQQNGSSISKPGHSIQAKPIVRSRSGDSTLIQRDIAISRAENSEKYQSYYKSYQTLKKRILKNFINGIISPKAEEKYETRKRSATPTKDELQEIATTEIKKITKEKKDDVLARDVRKLAPELVQENRKSIIDKPANAKIPDAEKFVEDFKKKTFQPKFEETLKTKIKIEKDSNGAESIEEFKERVNKLMWKIGYGIWDQNKESLYKKIKDFDERRFISEKTKKKARQIRDKEYEALENSDVLTGIVDELKERRFKHKIDILVDIEIALESLLPISKTKLFENKDNKALRQHVKDQAREITQNKIRKAISKKTDANMPATRKYLEMKAGKRGFKKAKSAADAVLKDLARKGAFQAYKDNNIEYLMEQTVRQAAWSKLRNKKQPSEHKDTAKEYAADQLDIFFKEHQKKAKAYAVEWKQKYIDDFKQNNEAKVKLDQATKEKVKGLGKTIVTNITAGSPEHSMSILSVLIDKAVPQPGDKASLNVEFNIPIGTSPGYVLLGIKATAARGLGGVVNAAPEMDKPDEERDSVEVRGDFIIGAGAKFMGGKVDGAVNVFLRAGAADSIKAAQAMSYGLYRFLAKKSKVMAQWWAGAGDTLNDISEEEQAEIWAAMVEEQVFAEDNGGGQVDTGAGGRARAKVDTGLVSLGGSIGGAAFTRYNEEIIGKQRLGKSPQNQRQARDRREKIRGKGFGAVSAKFSVGASQFGLAGGKVTVSYSNAFTKVPKDPKHPQGDKKTEVKTWELALSGDLELGVNQDTSALAAKMVGGAAGLAGQIKEYLKKREEKKNDQAHNKTKNDKTEQLRTITETLSTLGQFSDGIANSLKQNLKPLYQVEMPDKKNIQGDIVKPGGLKSGIFSKKKVRLTLAVGLSKGKRIIRVSIWDVSTIEFPIPGLGKIKAEKAHRIASHMGGYELKNDENKSLKERAFKGTNIL